MSHLLSALVLSTLLFVDAEYILQYQWMNTPSGLPMLLPTWVWKPEYVICADGYAYEKPRYVGKHHGKKRGWDRGGGWLQDLIDKQNAAG